MVRPAEALDTPFHEKRHGFTKVSRGEMMKSINVYAGSEGWFYEIWISSRLVVFGWCADQERAQQAAATA
jgi:hypothetical protein